ncbi:MAG TPA: YoaK family protein [Stellaceae bacterium]
MREATRQPGGDRAAPAALVRGMALAVLLAALAGMVDAIGYLHLKGPFVAFMTGNTTEMAVALGQGDLAQAGFIAELIALFVAGAAAGQVLGGASGRWHMTLILVAVTVLLAVAALRGTAPEPMVLAMGAMNSSMHRAGAISVSLTYVTGMLVRLGQGVGDLLTGRAKDWGWLAQAAPWFGLVAGATAGSAAYTGLGGAAMWAAVGLAGLLATLSAVIRNPD